MITNKKHNQIIEYKDKTINDYLAKILKLEKELSEAKDLKMIFEKITDTRTINSGNLVCGSYSPFMIKLNDNIASIEFDLFTKNKLIVKQISTKAILIDKNGKITEGVTSIKADKGYSYKLVRE